ncbi:hypothetical protein GUY44_06935 [Pimelobacter simplex]|uniref:Uncharacterized protein n=1 Tax=Nocardioides simplex TaxID=2045 RepID=A0A0A1DM81_NOCSI|nr:hypothetical protein [Pimelobacter simplex]AIY17747.1 hypothetical protein KR76_15030 [Pimelobacter simplex]MCG8150206.1 hypothetical protein [Pimelobacter simplex]GEB13584.1 hypothetical protein NSI01_18990 [Pimelobacter simplex]SFM71378.1 hypothetical protein SAMN05421671_3087 [Pimelobacter simplex]
MTTPTTSQRAGIVAHALHALANHIATHHLPEPGSIEIEHDHLEFHIAGDDAAVWIASLGAGVDDVIEQRREHGLTVHRVEGRLPNTGVRVIVEWMRFGIRGAGLKAVSSR